ncbi:hypothetical protein COV82_00545 [Candidatus Peregrinibacteria bacterium CG11_big_fil_rev_8_21_14_0_20_46_8]|nr:MAG: hypothetical protein COV82_00545 [Candidatus Peregrinibacteria bacterium CG11_big_fil_rev_8_21_14_0_20_46_8]
MSEADLDIFEAVTERPAAAGQRRAAERPDSGLTGQPAIAELIFAMGRSERIAYDNIIQALDGDVDAYTLIVPGRYSELLQYAAEGGDIPHAILSQVEECAVRGVERLCHAALVAGARDKEKFFQAADAWKELYTLVTGSQELPVAVLPVWERMQTQRATTEAALRDPASYAPLGERMGTLLPHEEEGE